MVGRVVLLVTAAFVSTASSFAPSTAISPLPAQSAPRVVLGALPSRLQQPTARLVAEEGLAFALRKLVRRTASHTVAGNRSRDWRGVFDNLRGSQPVADQLSVSELRTAIHDIAGHSRLGAHGELDKILSQYDRNADGLLTFQE